MTANEPRHRGSRTIYMPLRDGWEETEAVREGEAREACSQHLADLQAHADKTAPISPKPARSGARANPI